MNPTIKTIAKAAGVSTATVSKALNNMPDISEATKRHIRRICDEVGYTPNASARSLVSGNTRTVALLVVDISNPAVGEIARSVMSRMMRHDYSLFLCDSGNSPEQESLSVRKMLENQAAALIVQPVPHPDDGPRPWEAELARTGTPYITLSDKLPASDGSVLVDEAEGGRLAARHLYHRGHRSCAVFMPALLNSGYASRVQGFSAYMKEHRCNARLYSAPTGLDGEKAGLALARAWQKNEETAVFAADDAIAVGAMAGFAARGIAVPENLSLIGYGDLPYAALQMIRMTTVRFPTLEMGICASDAVVGILEKKEDALRQYKLSPTLIVRGTVKRIG